MIWRDGHKKGEVCVKRTDFYTLKRILKAASKCRDKYEAKREMVHATQKNVVTGGGCDCDKFVKID